jgi:hypothetical protein
VLRTRGRQVVAVLLALSAAGIVVLGAVRPQPSATAVRTQVRQVSLADQFALASTGWSYGYASSGLLVLAGALLVLATAARWPQRSDRFRRAAPVVSLASDDPAEVWRAQDAGLDPTVGSGRGQAPGAGSVTGVAPDVHPGGLRGTMDTADQAPTPPLPE